jgi:hypothetical protein
LKTNHRSIFNTLFILLLGLLLLTSCQVNNPQQESLATNTPGVQPDITTAVENQYPSTPEEVIRAFLIAYPSDNIYAVQFLSPTFVSTLDDVSASKLLPGSGEITGFIIEKGDTSAEGEYSEILPNVAFETTSREIQFNLEIVDGRWVISQILAK